MASPSEVTRGQLASFDNYQLSMPKLESQQPPLAISIPQLPALSSLRPPLSTTTGNRTYGSLSAASDIFGLPKEYRRPQPRRISALYPPPAPRSILASNGPLSERHQRRDYIRRSRDDSDRRRLKEQVYRNPKFRDYRKNADKSGSGSTNAKESPVWPDWMESDFWDAFLTIPDAGARDRFKLYRPPNDGDLRDFNKWKDAGRNQWIAKWLDICFNLRFPNASKEEKKYYQELYQERKKISSHIQVVKQKLREPVTLPESRLFKTLFPEIKRPSDDKSFKQYLAHHPVLIGLREGRLPPRHRIKVQTFFFDCTPITFDMYVTRRTSYHEQSPMLLHWYTPSPVTSNETKGDKLAKTDPLQYPKLDLSPENTPDIEDSKWNGDQVGVAKPQTEERFKQLERGNIESVANYRELFPELEAVKQSSEEMPEIIHIKSGLYLNQEAFPPNAEITTRFEIDISQIKGMKWKCKTTTRKHASLHGSSKEDPPVLDKVMPLEEVKSTYVNGHNSDEDRRRLRVPVSATFWAHAFSKLLEIAQKHDHDQRWSEFPDAASTCPTDELVRGITMYHEIYSEAEDREGIARSKRRAILLFTFEKVASQKDAFQTWQYLDCFPDREDVFAPLPPPYQQEQAFRNENFSSIYRHDPLPILGSDSLSVSLNYEPLSYGQTPPLTAGSTSTFDQFSFPASDLDGSNLSFMSEATQPNEAAQLDQSYPKLHSNSYRAMDPISMSFDASSDGWQLPPPLTTIYDPPPNFYGPITTLPPLSTTQIWDNDEVFNPPDWTGQNGYLYTTQHQHPPMR